MPKDHAPPLMPPNSFMFVLLLVLVKLEGPTWTIVEEQRKEKYAN